MMKRHLVLVFLALVFLPEFVEAQSFYAIRRERNFIVTGAINTSTYYGDLRADGDILDARPSLSIGAMVFATPRIGVRAEFSWLNFAAKDKETGEAGLIKRNLSFVSNNYELNVVGIVNLIPNGRKFYQRSKYNAYGFVGVGGLYFNPKAELNGKKYALQPLKTEGVNYSRFTFVIPYGIGGKVMVSPFLNIGVELGWRMTFTDYIDDVSTVYVDNASFTDPIAAALADRGWEVGRAPRPAGAVRGNPDKNDSYMTLSLRAEYYLPMDIFGLGQKRMYTQKRKAYYKKRRR